MSSSFGSRPSRTYRSALRAEQADQSRRRIVQAAAQEFADRGYRGTHLRDIAAAAGVSVQLVNLNGPKPALLLAALELLSLGSDSPTAVAELPGLREAVDGFTSQDDFLGWLADFAAESNARVCGIWQALEHASAEEPGVAAAFEKLVKRQRSDARLGVDLLLRLAGLRADDDLEPRADLLWALTLPDLYRRLVHQAGWAPEQYTMFLQSALRAALLSPVPPVPSE